MGTSNKVSMKEQNNIIPPAVIKADVNLSRLPFFALTRKGLKNFKTQLIITETRSNEGIEFIWKITANPEYGYPSPFAKKVHRAVEYMLTQNGFPVPDNLDFSFYEIADVLGIKPSGRTCGDIKRALLSIMFAAMLREQQKNQPEESKETKERFPLNSIGDVLGEVARQRAEFEAKQKRSDNAEEPEADESDE